MTNNKKTTITITIPATLRVRSTKEGKRIAELEVSGPGLVAGKISSVWMDELFADYLAEAAGPAGTVDIQATVHAKTSDKDLPNSRFAHPSVEFDWTSEPAIHPSFWKGKREVAKIDVTEMVVAKAAAKKAATETATADEAAAAADACL